MRRLFVIVLLGLGACNRDPAIVRELPASAKHVEVKKTDAPGSLEGDFTLDVSAELPEPDCIAFLTSYAPKEKLVAIDKTHWSHEEPGKLMVTAECSTGLLKYSYVSM